MFGLVLESRYLFSYQWSQHIQTTNLNQFPSSHNHGGKWVPPILVSFHLGWSSISMMMGERVDNVRTLINNKEDWWCQSYHAFKDLHGLFGFHIRHMIIVSLRVEQEHAATNRLRTTRKGMHVWKFAVYYCECRHTRSDVNYHSKIGSKHIHIHALYPYNQCMRYRYSHECRCNQLINFDCRYHIISASDSIWLMSNPFNQVASRTKKGAIL